MKNKRLFTTLVIGCNDKDAEIQLLSDEKIIEIINKKLNESKIYGATISNSFGLWRGKLEKSIKYEIVNTFYFSDSKFKTKINEIYSDLLILLNQYEITVIHSYITTNLEMDENAIK